MGIVNPQSRLRINRMFKKLKFFIGNTSSNQNSDNSFSSYSSDTAFCQLPVYKITCIPTFQEIQPLFELILEEKLKPIQNEIVRFDYQKFIKTVKKRKRASTSQDSIILSGSSKIKRSSSTLPDDDNSV